MQLLAGARTAGRHIEMRISAVYRHQVAVLDHCRGDVGVQIEADDDRHPSADQLAHAPQQLAFAVFVMLGDHRAVQVEVNRVQRQRLAQPVTENLRYLFECILGHVAARLGGAPGERQQPVTVLARAIDESAERYIEPGHGLEQRLAGSQRRPAIGARESLEWRQVRREGIGFVLKTADRDSLYITHPNS